MKSFASTAIAALAFSCLSVSVLAQDQTAKPDAESAGQAPPPAAKTRLAAHPKPEATPNAKPRNEKEEAAARKLAEEQAKSAKVREAAKQKRVAEAQAMRPGMEVDLPESARAKTPPPSTPGVREPKVLSTNAEYDQAIAFHGERVRAGSRDQKIKSIRALSLTNDSRALPVISAALEDTDADVRSVAAEGLGQLGVEECAAPLAKTLSSDANADVRTAAADALGSFNAKQGVTFLIAAAKDSSADVRAAVAEALSSYSTEEATVALLGLVADSDEIVRDAAAESLGYVADVRAVGPLVELLKRDGSQSVRLSAAYALAEFSDKRATQALSDVSKSDRDPAVRKAAAEALAGAGDGE